MASIYSPFLTSPISSSPAARAIASVSDTRTAPATQPISADDLHGTIIEEHIFHMAGAPVPQLQTEAAMLKAIRETGRTPVQRNTFYEPMKIWEAAPGAETDTGEKRSKMLEDNLATA